MTRDDITPTTILLLLLSANSRDQFTAPVKIRQIPLVFLIVYIDIPVPENSTIAFSERNGTRKNLYNKVIYKIIIK